MNFYRRKTILVVFINYKWIIIISISNNIITDSYFVIISFYFNIENICTVGKNASFIFGQDLSINLGNKGINSNKMLKRLNNKLFEMLFIWKFNSFNLIHSGKSVDLNTTNWPHFNFSPHSKLNNVFVFFFFLRIYF